MAIIKEKLTNNSDGFTLIEILVSIGIVAILSGVTVSIFLAVTSSYDKASVIKTINNEGNRVMEQASRSIKNASDAEQISSQRLRLKIPRESDNLEYSTNGECTELEIYLDGNQIMKRVINSTCEDISAANCPQASPCSLTNINVEVTSFTVAVVESSSGPDKIDLTLQLRQDPSISNPDPEQQDGVMFQTTALTRGY